MGEYCYFAAHRSIALQVASIANVIPRLPDEENSQVYGSQLHSAPTVPFAKRKLEESALREDDKKRRVVEWDAEHVRCPITMLTIACDCSWLGGWCRDSLGGNH
jgi:hypothetical protein